MPENLPYLESERHFRRYERYLEVIVNMWPMVAVFTPEPPVASVETLSSRIRIARDSLRNNQWQVRLNMAKFMQICDEITVSTNAQPGKVVCGPADLLRKMVPLGTKVTSVNETGVPATHEHNFPATIKLVNPSQELIHAVIILHHHQLLIEPTTIQCIDDVVKLAENYDVSVLKDNDIYIITS